MYNFHRESRPEGEPRGWLRTTWYGVTQQVIQSDIGYWWPHVVCRPDKNPRLASCLLPAITNWMVSAASWRQVNLDIDHYITSGRGGNNLQGSVAIDNESEDESITEVVAVFHRNLPHWGELVCSQPHRPPQTRYGGSTRCTRIRTQPCIANFNKAVATEEKST